MTQHSESDPPEVEYLCWFDGFTNDPSAMIKATSPSSAAAQYRKDHPDNSMCVYVRADKVGPLHWYPT